MSDLRTELPVGRMMKRGSFPAATERARITLLLDKTYHYVCKQYSLYLTQVRHPQARVLVRRAIEDGRGDEVLALLDKRQEALVLSVTSIIPALVDHEVQSLTHRFGKASIPISFNPTSPSVVDAMRQNTLAFIRNLNLNQRAEISAILTDAIARGESPVATSQSLYDVLDLTPYQQGLVDSYRGLLESNSAQALDRVLRDRRYDRGLENAIDADELLPQDRIDVMVERYQDRLLAMRGETIARTESLRVTETARQASMREIAEAAGLDPNLIVKQWMATNDARTRETHAEMDGQARLLDDEFDSPGGAALMHPGDSDAPADEVINCRCTSAHHVFPTLAEAQAFLLENGQGRYDEGFEPEEE